MGWTILKVGGTLVSASLTAILTAKDVQDFIIAFGFKIPLALVVFMVFLIFVMWWIWGLESYKRQREHSKPNLVWVDNHYLPLYAREAKQGVNIGDYRCHVLQIWFKNQPVTATEDSIATDITATVTFYDKTRKSKSMRISGCFIIAEALDYAGNTGNTEEVIKEWPPNDEPHKLQIVIKRHEEDNAIGFGKGPSFSVNKITKGKYYVRVDIKGTRVINGQSFWFELENQGAGKGLSLSNQIKKPDLRKEGFQTE